MEKVDVMPLTKVDVGLTWPGSSNTDSRSDRPTEILTSKCDG